MSAKGRGVRSFVSGGALLESFELSCDTRCDFCGFVMARGTSHYELIESTRYGVDKSMICCNCSMVVGRALSAGVLRG